MMKQTRFPCWRQQWNLHRLCKSIATDTVISHQRCSIVGVSSCREVIYGPAIDWKAMVMAQQPVIIRGFADDWPAVSVRHPRCWRDARNLKYGRSTDVSTPEPIVTVEYGGNYMSKDMTMVSVEYLDFIDFVFGGNSAAAGTDTAASTLPHIYLAQQEVGSVTPHLLGDIPAVPDITTFSTDTRRPLSTVQPVSSSTVNPTVNPSSTSNVVSNQRDNIYRVNIWISRGNIVSPVHFDPYHNLLCQVVGQKEVLLFDQDMSAHLTTTTGNASESVRMNKQNNTSCIDFESEDLQAVRRCYPGYDQLRGVQAVLSPGDGLFIPYKWWHYCKSLTSSVSINYWWL